MIREDSLVLILGKNKLWTSARVSAIDGEKLAVRLLLTGKEIAVDRSKTYPISQLANDAEGTFKFFCKFYLNPTFLLLVTSAGTRNGLILWIVSHSVFFIVIKLLLLEVGKFGCGRNRSST